MNTRISSADSKRCTGLLFFVLAAGAFVQLGLATKSLAAETPSAPAILQDLRSFRELGSVLMVAAHPDDENTQLIAYLARGRLYRTAYLSVTRGDGGQNLLGPEFDEELGVIRTQELLAARRIDSGQQFFTRAIDFGFSKDYRETLRIWDRQQVLSDVVRVIRTFQPDVIVTRFSIEPGNTHGHHTASAVLALEAFKLAGNPASFPEQLGGDIVAWQPKRIVMNGGGPGRGGGGGEGASSVVQIDAGGNDPVLNESFADIAGRSRAMHKSQGFGNFGARGGRGGPRTESFQNLEGERAAKDLLDGIDTTWNRETGGAEIGQLTDEIIAKFRPDDPAASVPDLLTVRKKLEALTPNHLVNEKRRQLDRILQNCLGLTVETVSKQAEVVPGEVLQLHHTASVHTTVPVRWMAVRFPTLHGERKDLVELHADQPATRESTQTVPSDTALSQPYWLREPHVAGIYQVADASLIGRPENPPAVPVEYVFEVGGQTLVIPDEPRALATAGSSETGRRRLEVVSPIALNFNFEVQLFAPGATRPVEVQIDALRAGVSGDLKLNVPSDWKVAPESQAFRLGEVGDRKRLSFAVTAPKQAEKASISAVAEVGGKSFNNRRVEIHYDHIPPLLLQPPTHLTAVSLDLAIRGRQVGYLPGAGDSVAESLEQMGYTVKQLSGADFTEDGLRGLDAVVIGIRAFNVRTDLATHMPALFAFAEAGGNVIVQYNRPDGIKVDKIAPFDLRPAQLRVTDENAAITFLEPAHPALNTPNKITSADFDGWVQERGLYFPGQWDEHFTPIIACNDPGETALKGGLLVAKYGRGYFVYTPLAWFRQLPAGVVGAYRLFANLVSLGKE